MEFEVADKKVATQGHIVLRRAMAVLHEHAACWGSGGRRRVDAMPGGGGALVLGRQQDRHQYGRIFHGLQRMRRAAPQI